MGADVFSANNCAAGSIPNKLNTIRRMRKRGTAEFLIKRSTPHCNLESGLLYRVNFVPLAKPLAEFVDSSLDGYLGCILQMLFSASQVGVSDG